MQYKRSLEKIAYIICAVMFFIFPTSINKVPHNVKITICLWLVQSAIFLFFVWQEKINMKQVIWAVAVITYLLFATVVALSENLLHVSLARIAPIVCFVVMCCTNFKSKLPATFFLRILDIMCCVLIIWNCLTLLRVEKFIEFVNNFYTQLDTYTATYWSLIKNNPIFTFGIHNFAAIFYLHIFMFCYFSYCQNRKRRYWIYMQSIWLFTLLLKSASGLGIFAIMALFILKLVAKDKKKLISLLFCMSILFILLSQTTFVNSYIARLMSKANGFAARYAGESDLFEGNFSILKRFPMGIGFHIGAPELNLYYADSGFIIYYTMGNVFALVCFLELIFTYYKNNLGIKMACILFLVILLTELSLVGFIYNKTLYLYVFEVGFYRSVLEGENKTAHNITGEM